MTVYKIILLKVKIQYFAFSLNRSTYSTLFYFVFFFFLNVFCTNITMILLGCVLIWHLRTDHGSPSASACFSQLIPKGDGYLS